MHIPHSLHLFVIMLTRNFVLEALTKPVVIDACVVGNLHHLLIFLVRVKNIFAKVKTHLSKDNAFDRCFRSHISF